MAIETPNPEYEQRREHHMVLQYTESVFPRGSNIFGVLQEKKRLIATRQQILLDEGICFDRQNAGSVENFRQHMLSSIAATLRSDNFLVDISLLQELTTIPREVAFADMRELIPAIGASREEMIPTTSKTAEPLMAKLIPEKTLEHEEKHRAMSVELGNLDAYYLLTLYMGSVEGKNVMMSPGGFEHDRLKDPFDIFRVCMAPDRPSGGDFRTAAKQVGEISAANMERVEEIKKNKSQTIVYIARPGELDTPISVHMPEFRPALGRVYDMSSFLSFDPRHMHNFIGAEYAEKNFCEKFDIPRSKVVKLGVTLSA